MMSSNSRRVRPSGWWFLLMPLVIIAGTVQSVATGFDQFGDIGDHFHRIGPDGTGTVELSAGDTASIWMLYEHGTDTRSMSKDGNVTVTGPDGASVEVDRASARSTFEVGDLGGIRCCDFDATVTGVYTVHAQRSSGASDVAVGNFEFARAIAATLAPGLIGVFAGVGMLVLLLVMRARSKASIRREAQQLQVSPGVQAPSVPPASTGPITFE
jgi:hypothetical protein